jgi:hypothetical protein
METLRNETDSIIYVDFYILVTTAANLTRQMKITNYCGKWELYLRGTIICTLITKFFSENLADDEITMFFKGRIIFKQYIPKKHTRFGIKLYKLCDSEGYTYHMTVYLGKDRKCETPWQLQMQLLTGPAARIERMGHKL